MSQRSPITTHVLDTAAGRPASGVSVRLERVGSDGSATELATGVTDADGRVTDLLAAEPPLAEGVYRISFDVGAYQDGFYPRVSIDFRVQAGEAHYHVPLLLSPFGFTTYRGS